MARSGTFVVPSTLMLVAGLVRIGDAGLRDDEHCTWWAIHLPWQAFVELIQNVDAVLTPYYLIMRAWTALVGDSEAMLRTPSTIAMACAAGLVALIGRRMVDSATGLFVGLSFTAIPSISYFAREARPYAFGVLAALLSTLLLLRALDASCARMRWVAYALSIALTGAMHLISLGVLAFHLSLLLSCERRFPWLVLANPAGRRWLIATAAGLTLTLPIVWLGANQSSQLQLRDFSVLHLLALVQTLPRDLNVGLLLILAIVAGCWKRHPLRAPLVVWMVVPPLLLCGTYPVLHIFRPRYLLYTLPAWAMLAVLGSARCCSGLRKQWVGPTALVFAQVAFGFASQCELRPLPSVGVAPFRYAARILAGNARSGDGIIYGGTTGKRYHGRLGIAYATRSLSPLSDILVVESAEERGRFHARESNSTPRALSSKVDRLWVMGPEVADQPLGGLPSDRRKALLLHYAIRQVWPLGSQTLLLMERRKNP